MKKIILSLFLLFGISYAESSSNTGEGEWKTFLGIEGGVGLYSIVPSIVVGYGNSYLFGQRGYTESFGYNLTLQLGWQKYYSETYGKRFILSLRGDYMQNYSNYKNGDTQFPLNDGYGYAFSFIQDWLFDFSVRGENRQGMFLGLGFDIITINIINQDIKKSEGYSGAGGGLSFVARIGYKAQIENDVFDITLNIPTLGCFGFGSFTQTGVFHAPVNTTLTAGYKHLF